MEAAGGWYVQLLPFADEATVERLTANLNALADRSPTQMIRSGETAESIVRLLLDGLEPSILSVRDVPPLSKSCPCSVERVYRTLRLLPRSEVDSILEKHEDVEVKCEFCGKRYALTPQQVRDELEASPSGDEGEPSG